MLEYCHVIVLTSVLKYTGMHPRTEARSIEINLENVSTSIQSLFHWSITRHPLSHTSSVTFLKMKLF